MATAAEVKPRTVQVTSCDHCPFRSRGPGPTWCAAPAAITPPQAAVAAAALNEQPPPRLCPLRTDAMLVVIG
jgi:hypothetical protein